MKNHLITTLLALGILIAACSPFSAGSSSTATPIDTVVHPELSTLTPVQTFMVISTEIPTLIPTLEPNSTASPMDSLTATMEETLTPVATGNSYTFALITNISISVTKNFTSCASTTPVSVTSYITSNNQTELQYKWLLSGTQSQTGGVRKTDMLSTAGTITLTINYKLKCGKYSVYFQVIYPNFVTGKKSFSIP